MGQHLLQSRKIKQFGDKITKNPCKKVKVLPDIDALEENVE